MADRIAEQGALQDAISNNEINPPRLSLAGYIRGLFLDWSASPYNPLTRLTARGRYLGYFWDNGAIGLSMDFANQSFIVKDGTLQSKSFSDIVNFSRTSNATVTNSAGVIGYAPHNLLTFSEQFDNAAWTKTTTTVTANAIASPNNTTTGDTLTASDANSTTLHSYTAIAQPYTFSIYIRRRTGTGTIDITADGSTYVAKTITSDWARFDTTITPTAGARTPGVRIVNSGDAIDVWGAQLEIGSTATTYNPTTVKNLLGYSELFDNAAWTKSNSFVQTNLLTFSETFDNAAWVKTTITATANSIVAPNGYQTADTLAATGANSTALQTFTASAVPYTYSVYLYRKTGTGNIDITVDGTTWVTKTITAGWTRVDTVLTPASGSKTAGIRIVTSGDEIYAWGAQLVQGSVAGDYRRTDIAALPIYYPNHNGVVVAEQIQGTAANGTVLESYTASGGSMTFSIWMRRITGTGNVDITMNTGSTWTTQSITSDWARYSITTTPDSGARTAGVRLVTSGDIIQIFGAQLSDSASLDPYVLTAAAAPTAAAYYGPRFDYDPVTLQPKGLLIEMQRANLLLNSSLAGTNLATQSVTVTAVAHTLSFYGTGNIVLTGVASATLTGTGAYPTRSTLTFTPTAGSLTLTVTGTVQYAQLEIGSFATSFIPTAASQVTRAADVATIQGSNFYSWYNQNEGSVYVNAAELSTATSGNRKTLYTFTTGNFNNIIRNGIESGTSSGFNATYESATQASMTISAAYQANVFSKSSSAYKTNDFYLNVNNGTASVDTLGTTPMSFFMNIGYGPQVSSGTANTAGDFLNGHIKSISYYPVRLSNNVLKGLTA